MAPFFPSCISCCTPYAQPRPHSLSQCKQNLSNLCKATHGSPPLGARKNHKLPTPRSVFWRRADACGLRQSLAIKYSLCVCVCALVLAFQLKSQLQIAAALSHAISEQNRSERRTTTWHAAAPLSLSLSPYHTLHEALSCQMRLLFPKRGCSAVPKIFPVFASGLSGTQDMGGKGEGNKSRVAGYFMRPVLRWCHPYAPLARSD